MAKIKTSSQFVCNSCGYESVQWYGKCPSCAAWNTMQQFKVQSSKFKVGGKDSGQARMTETVKPLKLSEIKSSTQGRMSSGIGELDRVLGGGFVSGEVVLLAGEPGVGKSTLLLKLGGFRPSFAEASAGKGVGEIIYVSGEESPEQIKTRAERLEVIGENMTVLAETNVEGVIRAIGEMGPASPAKRGEENQGKLLIVDSIQTLWSEDIEGSPGSVSQVKFCTQKLIEMAKKTGNPVILIGQINKEGEIAGPMMLNHMVDCVLFLEGERFADLRLLRGLKNRFGPTDEVGVFRMTEKGMEEVGNPSELFLEGNRGDRGNQGEIGSVIICAMEGTRPVLLEIQALVTKSAIPIPRRVVLGVDYNRVMLIIAVLQKNLHLPLYDQEIIVKVGGGFKVNEPAADLGIALAIISSFKNQAVKTKTCVFGEVGLLGEIRRVNGEERRIKEAKKMGFTTILSSGNTSSLREATSALEK